MVTENTLLLVFKNENGSEEKIKIKNTKDTLSSEVVNNLAQSIINENVFYSNGGDLISIEKATLEKVTSEEITLS